MGDTSIREETVRAEGRWDARGTLGVSKEAPIGLTDIALSFELETRLPSWILLIGDRASMAAGVEARVPLLDHRIVELIAPLPPSFNACEESVG